jgi:membrane-associated phospholipid phosphatase
MLVGKKKDEPEIFNTGRSAARALINAAIINYGMKFTAARERPLENDGKGRFWKGGSSFPSGHSMNTWSVAVVIARVRAPSGSNHYVCRCYRGEPLALGAQKAFVRHLCRAVLGGLIGNLWQTARMKTEWRDRDHEQP